MDRCRRRDGMRARKRLRLHARKLRQLPDSFGMGGSRGESKEPAKDAGNSGLFIFGHPEIQVLDSYENDTYPDGQAAAVYGNYPPLVNASRKPGEWQSYDIVYVAPQIAQSHVGQAGQLHGVSQWPACAARGRCAGRRRRMPAGFARPRESGSLSKCLGATAAATAERIAKFERRNDRAGTRAKVPPRSFDHQAALAGLHGRQLRCDMPP